MSSSLSPPPSSSSATVTRPRSSPPKYTVHEAIESIGYGRFQVLLTIVAGFAWIAESMEVMLLSIVMPSFVCEWGLKPFQQALCATLMFGGWCAGSPVWGWVCDRFGRKVGLLLSAVLGCVFGTASAAAPSFIVFTFLRTAVGLAVGGVPQSATILLEFLPTDSRASRIMYLAGFWALGASVVTGAAMVLTPRLTWRATVVASALPLGLFTVVAGMDGELIENTDHEVASKNTAITALLSAELRITSILLWIIWGAMAFSYYGLTFTTTKLFASTDTCHGGSVDNTNTTSTSCKELSPHDYVDILITTAAELPGLLLTLLIIERLGRRATMALQLGAFGIANVVLFFCLPRNATIGIVFVARAVIAGGFQAAYVYTPEVYPTYLRALALGTASMFGRVGTMITPFVSQVLGDWSLGGAFGVYGGVGLIGFLASFFLPIETSGRQLAGKVDL